MHLYQLLGLRTTFNRCKRAFTLVEILVSVTILLILMVVLFQLTATLAGVWTSSRGRISAFENARFAFSTLTSTLSRATLNTYVDYVNITGGTMSFRTPKTTGTFVPTQFARASELHFISGPTNVVMSPLYAASYTNPDGTTNPANSFRPPWTTPVGTTTANPGHAVCFQAPLGTTEATNFKGLNRTMNSVAFYVQYGQPPDSLFPSWLKTAAPAKDYRYRLLEFVEPTENLVAYNSSSFSNYDSGWINFAAFIPKSAAAIAGKPRARILAEDVLLLVLRPRVSTTDEKAAATFIGMTYDSTKPGYHLSPNYHYDSRAWMPTYPTTGRVSLPATTKRGLIMCNQVPPIVDVAMVCADSQSIARIGTLSADPPAVARLPIATAMGLFLDSSKLEDDLNTYAGYLSAKKINFHIMRSSVQIQSSRWANN